MDSQEIIHLTESIGKEWLWFIFAVILSFIVKDILSSIAKGFIFYAFNKDYTVGDTVIIGDNEAVIVRVGFLTTVFQLKTHRGIVWQFVPNSRLSFLGIKKVITPADEDDLQNITTPGIRNDTPPES